MSSSEAAVNPNGDKAFEIEMEEEKEVDQLEAEVNELAEKVIELRRTMKLVFRDKMEALLLAMRPKLPKDKPSSSEESKVMQGTGTTLASAREEQEVDQETAAQIALLKNFISHTETTFKLDIMSTNNPLNDLRWCSKFLLTAVACWLLPNASSRA